MECFTINKNHQIILNTNKNIIIKFTDERIIPASGLSVVGAILIKNDFIKNLNHMNVTFNRSQHLIKNDDIILSYLGMLCIDKPCFETIHEMNDDKDFYKVALRITRNIASEETLRQTILEQNIEVLLTNNIQLPALANGLVPIDIYVTLIDNSKSNK